MEVPQPVEAPKPPTTEVVPTNPNALQQPGGTNRRAGEAVDQANEALNLQKQDLQKVSQRVFDNYKKMRGNSTVAHSDALKEMQAVCMRAGMDPTGRPLFRATEHPQRNGAPLVEIANPQPQVPVSADVSNNRTEASRTVLDNPDVGGALQVLKASKATKSDNTTTMNAISIVSQPAVQAELCKPTNLPLLAEVTQGLGTIARDRSNYMPATSSEAARLVLSLSDGMKNAQIVEAVSTLRTGNDQQVNIALTVIDRGARSNPMNSSSVQMDLLQSLTAIKQNKEQKYSLVTVDKASALMNRLFPTPVAAPVPPAAPGAAPAPGPNGPATTPALNERGFRDAANTLIGHPGKTNTQVAFAISDINRNDAAIQQLASPDAQALNRSLVAALGEIANDQSGKYLNSARQDLTRPAAAALLDRINAAVLPIGPNAPQPTPESNRIVERLQGQALAYLNRQVVNSAGNSDPSYFASFMSTMEDLQKQPGSAVAVQKINDYVASTQGMGMKDTLGDFQVTAGGVQIGPNCGSQSLIRRLFPAAPAGQVLTRSEILRAAYPPVTPGNPRNTQPTPGTQPAGPNTEPLRPADARAEQVKQGKATVMRMMREARIPVSENQFTYNVDPIGDVNPPSISGELIPFGTRLGLDVKKPITMDQLTQALAGRGTVDRQNQPRLSLNATTNVNLLTGRANRADILPSSDTTVNAALNGLVNELTANPGLRATLLQQTGLVQRLEDIASRNMRPTSSERFSDATVTAARELRRML